MLRQLISTIIVISFATGTLAAQEITVRGGFFEKQVRLGEPVNYYLTAEYPANMEVLFPDSTFDFGIFEFERKQYFPSLYDSTTVIDSAVYTLTSFEIEPYQRLALPIFIISGQDSTSLAAASDSLIYLEVAPLASDTTSLITDLTPAQVPLQFNYPYYVIGAGILGFIALVLALVFGKKVLNQFRIRSVQRGFGLFSHKYDNLVSQVALSPQPDRVEQVVGYWKRYLEKLEGKPYTKLTTKELIAYTGDHRLKQNLIVIDKSIYGKTQEKEELLHKFQSIKDLAKEYQERKIAELKHGQNRGNN